MRDMWRDNIRERRLRRKCTMEMDEIEERGRETRGKDTREIGFGRKFVRGWGDYIGKGGEER